MHACVTMVGQCTEAYACMRSHVLLMFNVRCVYLSRAANPKCHFESAESTYVVGWWDRKIRPSIESTIALSPCHRPMETKPGRSVVCGGVYPLRLYQALKNSVDGHFASAEAASMRTNNSAGKHGTHNIPNVYADETKCRLSLSYSYWATYSMFCDIDCTSANFKLWYMQLCSSIATVCVMIPVDLRGCFAGQGEFDLCGFHSDCARSLKCHSLSFSKQFGKLTGRAVNFQGGRLDSAVGLRTWWTPNQFLYTIAGMQTRPVAIPLLSSPCAAKVAARFSQRGSLPHRPLTSQVGRVRAGGAIPRQTVLACRQFWFPALKV